MQTVIIGENLVKSGNGVKISVTPLKILRQNPNFDSNNYRTLDYNNIEAGNIIRDLLCFKYTLQDLLRPQI